MEEVLYWSVTGLYVGAREELESSQFGKRDRGN